MSSEEKDRADQESKSVPLPVETKETTSPTETEVRSGGATLSQPDVKFNMQRPSSFNIEDVGVLKEGSIRKSVSFNIDDSGRLPKPKGPRPSNSARSRPTSLVHSNSTTSLPQADLISSQTAPSLSHTTGRRSIIPAVPIPLSEKQKGKPKIQPKDGWDPKGLPIQSLDYDQFNSDVLYKELKRKTAKVLRNEQSAKWFLTFLVGIFLAFLALLLHVSVTHISDAKLDYAYARIDERKYYAAYFFLLATNFALGLGGALPIIFIEPIASGGGIAEVKSLLNGMKIPRAVHFKTLVVKILGTVCSVSSGLPVGKEGPMIHSGAIVAAGLSQGKSTTLGFDTSWTKFQPFRNDREKRDFISCGAAAGVGAAFASPIGGMLFSLEEGASFWHPGLTVRCFFCTMVCTTTVAVLFSVTNQGDGGQRVAGLFTFGDFNLSNQNQGTYALYELIFFAVLGVVGGVLGGFWVRFNTIVMRYRVKYTKLRPFNQIADVLLMVFLYTSISFGLAFLFKNPCHKLPTGIDSSEPLTYADGYVRGTCADGDYNEMFTLYMSTSETAILSLFHNPNHFQAAVLVPFFITYFFLSSATCGTPVPSGLFIPTLLCGGIMGRLYGQFFAWAMPSGSVVDPGTYALVGAAAFMGGVTRSLVALCIMLVEATGNIQYGLPMMVALICAKFVGDRISLGIYETQIIARKWAFLEPEPPPEAATLQAHEIMNADIMCIPEVIKAGDLYQLLLENTQTNAFPVVSQKEEPQPIPERPSSQASVTKPFDVKDSTTLSPASPPGTLNSPLLDVHPDKETRRSSSASQLGHEVDTAPPQPLPPAYEQPSYLHRYQTFWMPTSDESRMGPTATHNYGGFRGLILRKHLLVILKYHAFFKEKPEPGTNPPLLEWFTFEHRYPRYPELHDIHLSDVEKEKWVDVTPYMHRSPNTVFWFSPVTQVYNIFRTLGLRHLVVLNAAQEVVGLVTRKSLTHDFIERVAHAQQEHHRQLQDPSSPKLYEEWNGPKGEDH